MKLSELIKESNLTESDDRRKQLIAKREELKATIKEIETEWAALDDADKHAQAEVTKMKVEKQLRDKLSRVRKELDKIFDAIPV